MINKKRRPLVITTGPRNCTLSGSVNAKILEAIRDMPGRKRWDNNGQLLFEPSAANIRHLKKELPEAKWIDEGKRLKEIEEADRLEKAGREGKKRKLPPEAAKSFPFRRKCYEHQLKSFHRFKDAKYFGLLFDIGTGKSKAMIDIASYKYMKGEIDCFFILVWPSGIAEQYVEQALIDHVPTDVKTISDWYSPKRRKHHDPKLFIAGDKLRCYAMNIEAISRPGEGRRLAEGFIRSGRCMFLIVESFTIKSPSSERSEWCWKWGEEAKVRAIETGSPTPEGLEDLFGQMKFLSEDVLGYSSFYTFRNRYCDVIPAYKGAPHGAVKITGYRNVKELWDKVDAHCMRVKAEDCLDLPPARDVVIDVKLTKEQENLYKQLNDKFEYMIDHSGGHVKADQAITRMMRMQQVVCGHVPIVTSTNDDGSENVRATRVPSNRAQAAIDFWIEGNRAPMVIWARFHADFDILTEAFGEIKNPPRVYRYDGTISKTDRARFLNDFITKKAGIMLINQASGSAGLDGLQKMCQLVLFYSEYFDSLYHYQSKGRTRRIGAVGSCLYGRLRAPKTIDDYIHKAVVKKITVSRLFLDEPEGWKELASGG